MTAASPILRTVEGPIIVDWLTWAVLSVDIMKTFMTGGGLGVLGGHEIVLPGLRLIRKFDPTRRYALRDLHWPGSISYVTSFVGYPNFYRLHYDEVRRWTPKNHRIAKHAKFSLRELKRACRKAEGRFITLYPEHAQVGSDESRVEEQIERESTMTWYKGNRPHADSKSGFIEDDGKSTGLGPHLKWLGAKVLVVWGIAGDVCAGLTALHGKQLGFEVYFVTDLSPCISPEGRDAMYQRLIDAGVHLITSDQIQMAA